MLSRRALTARELRVFLVMAYPSAVFAASGALGNQFDQWTARSFAALALLIAVGGLTGLAHRLAGELEVWGELRYPKSFIFTNSIGAVAGGLLALFATDGVGAPSWLQSIAVMVVSAAGSLAVERVWKSWADRNLPVTPDEPKTQNFNTQRLPPAFHKKKPRK